MITRLFQIKVLQCYSNEASTALTLSLQDKSSFILPDVTRQVGREKFNQSL